jgi:hypothetical protein
LLSRIFEAKMRLLDIQEAFATVVWKLISFYLKERKKKGVDFKDSDRLVPLVY